MAEPAPSVAAKVLKAKVCLVGDEAVGKTSLVHRFVHEVFDESYIRTLGAVPTKKALDLVASEGRPVHVDLTILDIMGRRTFLELFKDAYFHGAQGILAVVDVTHRATLERIGGWVTGVRSVAGDVPIVLVANKADLAERAEYGAAEVKSVARSLGGESFVTSAKTGDDVEAAFHRLATLVADRLLRV